MHNVTNRVYATVSEAAQAQAEAAKRVESKAAFVPTLDNTTGPNLYLHPESEVARVLDFLTDAGFTPDEAGFVAAAAIAGGAENAHPLDRVAIGIVDSSTEVTDPEVVLSLLEQAADRIAQENPEFLLKVLFASAVLQSLTD